MIHSFGAQSRVINFRYFLPVESFDFSIGTLLIGVILGSFSSSFRSRHAKGYKSMWRCDNSSAISTHIGKPSVRHFSHKFIFTEQREIAMYFQNDRDRMFSGPCVRCLSPQVELSLNQLTECEGIRVLPKLFSGFSWVQA